MLFLLVLIEACYLWLGQLERVRAERAYWETCRTRPELYDWAQEPDL